MKTKRHKNELIIKDTSEYIHYILTCYHCVVKKIPRKIPMHRNIKMTVALSISIYLHYYSYPPYKGIL